jgi:hypothetical protein
VYIRTETSEKQDVGKYAWLSCDKDGSLTGRTEGREFRTTTETSKCSVGSSLPRMEREPRRRGCRDFDRMSTSFKVSNILCRKSCWFVDRAVAGIMMTAN